MNYYSTNRTISGVSLRDAVAKGLAADGGVFMPELIGTLPSSFIRGLPEMTLQEMSLQVAEVLFGEDVEKSKLEQIVDETLNFDIPLVHVSGKRHALELYHGPTLAFKDIGARFMARLLGYFVENSSDREINVLVATSGDTGGAVANGFLDVPGIRVFVLYPSGKVSDIQEKQFSTLGRNIVAIEIDGTFDDCQALVKRAFTDRILNDSMRLTSANSINIARLFPQSFFYFHAYAQLLKQHPDTKEIVFSVPSGNLGNLTAGVIAKRMGLPIKRFIAANNRNDVFSEYLHTGVYTPRKSVITIANAMDVGNPNNFARIIDLYDNSYSLVRTEIDGRRYDDEEIRQTIRQTWSENSYLLDPHGACGYRALIDCLQPQETGIVLETAHPAKFREQMEATIGMPVALPESLSASLTLPKQSIRLTTDFDAFRAFLLSQQL